MVFIYDLLVLLTKTYLENVLKTNNKVSVKMKRRGKFMKLYCRIRNHILPRPRFPALFTSEAANSIRNSVVAYVNHKNLIKAHLEDEKQTYEEFRAACSQLGWLEVCGVCDARLTSEECFYCNESCTFCIECVRKYAEDRIKEDHTTFPCCNACDSVFEIHILQMAFPKAVFRRLWLKIQREELEKAEVDLIVSCPFCEFVVTPLAEASVFKCGKESCRLCTRKSHIPTRCSEVPLDKEVQIRTFLEDKWTEAVTRTCFSCKKSFIKTRGCNKMTCTCGASMCYICSQLISGYEHFDVLDGNRKIEAEHPPRKTSYVFQPVRTQELF
ncbi:hypothetical protein HUJ05_008879 [Dendroctonus ponderosae]|nr:hypothetical protein HUJ05_008879 [Dendroctonus ponderosae]